jgi:hypothetical protein
MLAAAYQPLKFVFPVNLAPQNIEDKNAVAEQLPPPIKKQALLSSKIFSIRFHYLQQVIDTKVLKVVYGSGETIYKVALNSALSKWTNICWFQRHLTNWVILLGTEPDAKLKFAISSAIERQEFTNNLKSIIV